MGITFDPPIQTPKRLVAGAIYHREFRLAELMANYLGRSEDAKFWRTCMSRIGEALHRTYFDSALGSYGTQCANALALAEGYVPAELREQVLQALRVDLVQYGHRLTCGLIGAPDTLRILSEAGFVQDALMALVVKNQPGFLWMIEQGCTTLGEHIVDRWKDTSGNQPGWSLIGAWMLQQLAGIECLTPGWGKVRVQPRLPMELQHVKAICTTPRGPLTVEWKRIAASGEALEITVRHPLGVEVELQVAAGSRTTIGVG
jgi:alpha-L-rhamnosidase